MSATKVLRVLRSQDTPTHSEMIAKVDPAQSDEQSKSEPYIEHVLCQFVCNKNVMDHEQIFWGGTMTNNKNKKHTPLSLDR